MPTITLANQRTFKAEPGISVLDAAQQQGLTLEHSCRTGRCGSCKSQLTAGLARALLDPVALTAQEQGEGWILTCTHEATTDLSLDIEDLGALQGIPVQTLPARIASLEPVAEDVVRVVLRLPPSAKMRFLAGQYIDVIGPEGVRRSYSIASDPQTPDRLELLIRRVPQGRLSAYWFGAAQVNDLLRFVGPRGTFYLRPVAGQHLVLLATGTGIAPLQSMLATLARLAPAEQPASVSLYWGQRQAAELHLDPSTLLPGLRYVPVLSRPDAGWQGAAGHVQGAALAGLRDVAHTAVYACGSNAMIRDARQQFLAAGLPPRQFHSDAFVSSN